MHIKFAQIVVDKGIGSNYVIYKVEETEKYIFAYYKHQFYDIDDERGHLIGVGPVVFIKETSEYKLLGSGEILFGDYFDFEDEIKEEKIPDFKEIKNGILRRKYVSNKDIFDLEYNWDRKFNDKSNVGLTFRREINFEQFLILNSSNKEFLNFIEKYWLELNLDFQKVNDGQVILKRVY